MSQPVKVLIADDEQIMREGLRLTIDWESYGFSVIGAVSNGEKALRLCEEETPDLVITDIRMPVMDGLCATKEIRRLSRRDASGIPVIAMTADAFAEDITVAMQAGMNAHIAKPIEVQQLYRLIDSFLA
mgnify:CR=1 FL=1